LQCNVKKLEVVNSAKADTVEVLLHCQ